MADRLQAWRQTKAGHLVWYAAEVGVVTGLYYGTARAGLHLAYLHGSVTALWPPVGVGIAALVIGGPSLWPGIVAGDLLVADFSTPCSLRPLGGRDHGRDRVDADGVEHRERLRTIRAPVDHAQPACQSDVRRGSAR